jgi:hypothetical protein
MAMTNKRVWLTPKGQRKVGSNYINTLTIVTQSPYIVVTSADTGKTHILDKDDIVRIDD